MTLDATRRALGASGAPLEMSRPIGRQEGGEPTRLETAQEPPRTRPPAHTLMAPRPGCSCPGCEAAGAGEEAAAMTLAQLIRHVRFAARVQLAGAHGSTSWEVWEWPPTTELAGLAAAAGAARGESREGSA
jgi:hypothetical protein